MSPNIRSRLVFTVVPLSALLSVCPSSSRCQDSGDQGTMVRGDRAEISITVRDASGALITTPCSVKLYKNGAPSDQSSASHGRAFFIPRGFGDFTIVVEAAGYKSTQKEISITVAGKEEIDIYMQRELAANESTGCPASPSWLPRPRKRSPRRRRRSGRQTRRSRERTDQSRKLAPSNPDVLYMQGMLYLRQRRWEKAETVLQKADQIDPNQRASFRGWVWHSATRGNTIRPFPFWKNPFSCNRTRPGKRIGRWPRPTIPTNNTIWR